MARDPGRRPGDGFGPDDAAPGANRSPVPEEAREVPGAQAPEAPSDQRRLRRLLPYRGRHRGRVHVPLDQCRASAATGGHRRRRHPLSGSRPARDPVGIEPSVPRFDHAHPLPPGATLLLLTDGLVERRDEGIDVGLRALAGHASRLVGAPVDVLCDELMAGRGRSSTTTSPCSPCAFPARPAGEPGLTSAVGYAGVGQDAAVAAVVRFGGLAGQAEVLPQCPGTPCPKAALPLRCCRLAPGMPPSAPWPGRPVPVSTQSPDTLLSAAPPHIAGPDTTSLAAGNSVPTGTPSHRHPLSPAPRPPHPRPSWRDPEDL